MKPDTWSLLLGLDRRDRIGYTSVGDSSLDRFAVVRVWWWGVMGETVLLMTTAEYG